MPPLERILSYIDLVRRLRKASNVAEAHEFISRIGTIAPDTVRQDLLDLDVRLPLKGLVDLNDIYWRLVREQDAIELKTSNAHVAPTLPNARDVIANCPTQRRGTFEGLAAARILDRAFDLLASDATLVLPGHGKASDAIVAHVHQLRTARQVLVTSFGTAIVADEVGLGKTMVAGLLIEELLAADPDARVLILVPSNLREQWQSVELPKLFGRIIPPFPSTHMSFYVERERVVLLPLDQAKGRQQDHALADLLRSRLWDLLVIDEAHDCRNADSARFRFVYSLRAKRKLFLSATPLHNSGYDLYSVVTLLRPGMLGDRKWFGDTYMDGERLLADGDNLKAAVMPILLRTTRAEAGLKFPLRRHRIVEIRQFGEAESTLYNELLAILKGTYSRYMSSSVELSRASGATQRVSQFVLTAMLVLREMASHPLAAVNTLNTALRDRVREFAEVTRDDTELNRLDAFIKTFSSVVWDHDRHAKSARLIDEIAQLIARRGRVIIYVNYLKTLDIIAKVLRLKNRKLSVFSYEGKLATHQKTDVLKSFQATETSCLISTDAGGQGLNLQFANCVINYDFPWNPMRIEQRVGRVDRLGQESRSVEIVNFRTLGTVEEYVQIVLTKKLKECQSVLGDFASPFQIEKLYEDRLAVGIGTALLQARDVHDMRRRMSRLGEGELREYIGEMSTNEGRAANWQWRPSGL
jgi:SNF2 family DNA or RNA helicase